MAKNIFSFRASQQLFKRMDELAKEVGISRSELTNIMLDFCLNRFEFQRVNLNDLSDLKKVKTQYEGMIDSIEKKIQEVEK